MTTQEKIQEVIKLMDTTQCMLIHNKELYTPAGADQWKSDHDFMHELENKMNKYRQYSDLDIRPLSEQDIGRANIIYSRWKFMAKYSGNALYGAELCLYDFKNKHIAFTGFRDHLAESKLKNDYGSVVHSGSSLPLNPKLDYLICKNPNRDTLKLQKAKADGAVILTYAEFKKHL